MSTLRLRLRVESILTFLVEVDPFFDATNKEMVDALYYGTSLEHEDPTEEDVLSDEIISSVITADKAELDYTEESLVIVEAQRE